MNSIKSKQRVADHGEVFTPTWIVEAMLDLLKDFHLLVRLRVFNTEQMNQAVFAFRRYEDASLRYTGIDSHPGLTHCGLYDAVVAREWCAFRRTCGAFDPILKMAGRMAALLYAVFLLTLCACSAIITSARLLGFCIPRRNVHQKLQIAAPLPG